MPNSEFEKQVSRELGEIHSKLESMDQLLKSESGKIDSIWRKLSNHSESITTLKVKLFFVAAAVSTGVSLFIKFGVGNGK